MQDLQDIYRLQAFVTVVEEGSLSAAVGKLHITQPALSSRLKLLEENLNCILLERTGRGVRPTPMGQIVYGIAVDIIDRMKSLQTTLRNHIELREGWVHLSGGATATAGVFPQAIVEFRKRYPDIQFTLQEQESHPAIQAVRDGSVDIAVVTKNPEEDGSADNPLNLVEIHGTIRDRLEVVASKDHPLSIAARALREHGKTLLPMHLNRQNMILPDPGLVIRDIIDTEFRRLYIHPREVMTLRSTQGILQLVDKNIGVSVVSVLSVCERSCIQTLQVEGLKMERQLCIVGPKERTLPPAAQRFLEFLVEMSKNIVNNNDKISSCSRTCLAH